MRTARAAAATILASTLVLTGCSQGSAAQPATTPSAPVNTTQPLPADVQASLDTFRDAGAVGAIMQVTKGDQTWEGTSGVIETGKEAPKVDSPLRVASVSKSFVAALTLQFQEKGKIDLDENVETYLPGVLPSDRAVTVRQLLDHTSGLSDSGNLNATTIDEAMANSDRKWTAEEHLQAALAKPWAGAPGEKFNYSNENYVLVGMIIEKVTGEKVGDLLKSKVFKPAGMTKTTWPNSPAMPARYLHGYLRDGDRVEDISLQDPSLWSTGAQAVSTVPDVNRFFRGLFDGTLVNDESRKEMQAIGTSGYGLGLLAGGDACGKQPPELVYGQRGNGYGYNTISFSSPDGERQVTLAWTGGTTDPATDPLSTAMNTPLVAGLAATC